MSTTVEIQEKVAQVIEVDSRQVIVETFSDKTDVIVEVPEHHHGFPIRDIETPNEPIEIGETHVLPNGLRYTPDINHKGRNLHITVSGVFLTPHSGPDVEDGDYREESATEVIFNFRIPENTPINYLIYG